MTACNRLANAGISQSLAINNQNACVHALFSGGYKARLADSLLDVGSVPLSSITTSIWSVSLSLGFSTIGNKDEPDKQLYGLAHPLTASSSWSNAHSLCFSAAHAADNMHGKLLQGDQILHFYILGGMNNWDK